MPKRSKAPQLGAVLFVPDCHHPFADEDAWNVLLRSAHILRPRTVVVLGDFMDNYSCSAHSRDPERKIMLDDEAYFARQRLIELEKACGPQLECKVFIEGNHEDRLRRYIWDHAPDLSGCVDIETLLGTTERGWQHIPYGDGVWIGKVYCTHDLGKASKYAVHHALNDAGCNVVIGHVHRMCTVYGGTAHGATNVAACFGWLGRDDVAHDYKHRLIAQRDYQLGFGIGYVEADTGNVHLQAVPIVEGRCVVNGEVVGG